jgi:DNA-binding GntR family transcriptional regulator
MTLERPKSLTTIVYDELLDSITGGKIPFGRLLSEKVLAAEYGTSKTPVREAFGRLQSVGLVEVSPQKGCFVFRPTNQQVDDLCEVRIVIEAAAMRFAMEGGAKAFVDELEGAHLRAGEVSRTGDILEYNRCDDAFHRTFLKHCGNEMLVSAYEIFQPRIQTLRINLQTTNGYLVDVSVADHGEIVSRLRKQDVEGAAEMMAVHVRRMSAVYASNWAELMRG